MAGALTRVLKEVRSDVEAARVRDPAARDVSFLGILSSWGGVQALLAHRIAHRFHRRGARLAPRVIVYGTRALTGIEIHPGAKLLGPIRVEDGAKIGANTVVVTDVPASATVVGNPGHIVRVDGHKPSGPDTDWIHLPDPVQDAIKQLSERLTEIERRLEAVDGEAAEAEVRELRPKRGPSTAGG